MTVIPDILGYKLKDAEAILKASSLEYTITESLALKHDKQKIPRIIQVRNLPGSTIELIISYF
ncbi:hypothetical protein SAMN05660297_00227 [Natronincola peptidivorans]|uniref:PASTA domain-containing protein n=1 Tax=Natronincola peptidivorans TaxID=426128 RepID=A0A1H9YH10_9FIRM|nr:hypothetical protein [Natronincola peptidivorans]SES68225.1 hypothetical protein SAMN05660297_00227 [Natronincola peptidivorans]